MANITVQRVLIEAQAILNSSSAMKSEERPAYLLAVIAAALINIGDQLETMPGVRRPM
jgi:hypothetical protein